jgi:L-ascorbate metabolism protein UlaG (beta-lactamase superfamily)
LRASWLGYATLRLESEDAVVYTDPGRYGVLTGEWQPAHGRADVPHPRGPAYDARDGDLVVVTHDHHYDADGIRRVAADDATILVYEAVDASRIGRAIEPVHDLPIDVRRVAYGDSLAVGSVDVEVVPAYNHADGANVTDSGEPIHPEGFGCGYRLTVDDTPCFYPGDSDVIPAHDALDVSLFAPPIGRSFTMDRHEAADLAAELDPDLVVPIHYNTFEELRADSRSFAADVASQSILVALDEGWPEWAR